MEYHYGILASIIDLIKTALGVVFIKLIGSLNFPGYLHDWLACIVALLGIFHIGQKIYWVHKFNKRRKKKEEEE
jgi:hypothetical protein